MLSIHDTPDFLHEMQTRSKDLAARFIEALGDCGRESSVEPGRNLYSREEDALYYVKKGFLRLFQGTKVIRFYMNRDLVPVSHFPGQDEFRITCGFPAAVSVYPMAEVRRRAAESPEVLDLWLEWLNLEMHIKDALCAVAIPDEHQPDVQVLPYKEGETIIHEGDDSDGLFLLLDGEATVTVRNQPVGEIHKDEFFGEISFLTKRQRSASVVAKGDCMTQFINRDDLQLLVKYKPSFFINIARDLAGRVANLNEKLTRDN